MSNSQSLTYEMMLENQKKGCGKEFLDDFWGRRVCGHFEDLKHSDHIIYCPECKTKLNALIGDSAP